MQKTTRAAWKMTAAIIITGGSQAMQPQANPHLSFDPTTEYTPQQQAGHASMFVARPSQPYDTSSIDLIAQIKAPPPDSLRLSFLDSSFHSQHTELILPFWAQLQTPPTQREKILCVLYAAVLATAQANAMVPIYLSLVFPLLWQDPTALAVCMWTTALLHGAETFLKSIHRRSIRTGFRGWKIAAQLPDILLPTTLLSHVELKHHQLTQHTGAFDAYLVFLSVVGPFLLCHSLVDAFSRCRQLFPNASTRDLEFSIDQMSLADLHRVNQEDIHLGEVMIPRKKAFRYQNGSRTFVILSALLSASASWACYQFLFEKIGLPVLVAAGLASWASLWTALQWYQTWPKLVDRTWSFTDGIGIPYAMLKTLPYAWLSFQGALLPTPIAASCSVFFAMQLTCIDFLELNSWLRSTILSLPALQRSPMGKKHTLKERLAFDDDSF